MRSAGLFAAGSPSSTVVSRGRGLESFGRLAPGEGQARRPLTSRRACRPILARAIEDGEDFHVGGLGEEIEPLDVRQAEGVAREGAEVSGERGGVA